MNKLLIGACALCAGALWFVAPYLTLYTFVTAVKAGDQKTLQEMVSWPDVRQGLKEDLNAVLAKQAANNKNLKDNPFGSFAPVLASVIMDRAIHYSRRSRRTRTKRKACTA